MLFLMGDFFRQDVDEPENGDDDERRDDEHDPRDAVGDRSRASRRGKTRRARATAVPGTLKQRTERSVHREADAGYQRIGWLNLVVSCFNHLLFSCWNLLVRRDYYSWASPKDLIPFLLLFRNAGNLLDCPSLRILDLSQGHLTSLFASYRQQNRGRRSVCDSF